MTSSFWSVILILTRQRYLFVTYLEIFSSSWLHTSCVILSKLVFLNGNNNTCIIGLYEEYMLCVKHYYKLIGTIIIIIRGSRIPPVSCLGALRLSSCLLVSILTWRSTSSVWLQNLNVLLNIVVRPYNGVFF